jgi:hypothetical protein
MARAYPATAEEFARIPNVGSKKAADFGVLFVAAILEHGQGNPPRP